MKRPLFFVFVLAVAFGLVGLGFLVFQSKENAQMPTGMSVELMPGSGADETTPSSIPSEEVDPDAGSDTEAIEKIMAEIEKTAHGDEGALENEYAAESESFMEGAVVLEQLGTSYDETSY